MEVRRILLPDSAKVTWMVVDRAYQLIIPIQEFLDYLRNIERSPNTVRSYAYHLKLYWEYLQDTHLDWKLVGLSELSGFIAWLRNPTGNVPSVYAREAKRTEATLNAMLTSVCMFYEYQERLGRVREIPLYRMQLQPGRKYKSYLHHLSKGKPVRTRLLKLKEPKRYPKTLDQEQVKKLIGACRRVRDKFLVCLLYESGMRIGQALGLRHSDIQSWDNLIQIVPRDENANGARSKGRDSYTIHVSRELMELYADYLLSEFDEIDSDYVFVNLWDGHIGAPMTYAAVADLFRRLSKSTGIEVHSHMLRHTHATELIRNGWDAAHIQKRLGHQQVQTVLNTYTHLRDEDLKKAYGDYLIRRERRNHESTPNPVV